MLAADTQTVTDLNRRARAQRVRAGHVAADGVQLADGTTAGVGDSIVTRLNQRALATGRGWVKNGDDWVVTATGHDGSLQVTRPGGGAVAVLPADYVGEHVELGYASTAHRAQGRTVNTTHAYVNTATLREALYVMASRGRESNLLYIDTAPEQDSSATHSEMEQQPESLEVLRKAITTSGADLAAHEIRRREQVRARQRAVDEPRPSHLLEPEEDTFGHRREPSIW
jgi:ATP-dependent exoDNAse (exonuclease V) alpha subunit